jgi:hypothetical protein
MAVYAPTFTVEVVGGGHFQGAIVGDTVTFSSGATFSYDQALEGEAIDAPPASARTGWIDRALPPR